jgi:hypothetical protein
MHGRVSSAPDPGSPCPFWTKPANPRRLVMDDDGYVSSCSYPYPAALDGIPGRVPSYHRLGPLQGLRASRYPGAYASLLHQKGGSCTRTRLKLHGPKPVPVGRDCGHFPAERIARNSSIRIGLAMHPPLEPRRSSHDPPLPRRETAANRRETRAASGRCGPERGRTAPPHPWFARRASRCR